MKASGSAATDSGSRSASSIGAIRLSDARDLPGHPAHEGAALTGVRVEHRLMALEPEEAGHRRHRLELELRTLARRPAGLIVLGDDLFEHRQEPALAVA